MTIKYKLSNQTSFFIFTELTRLPTSHPFEKENTTVDGISFKSTTYNFFSKKWNTDKNIHKMGT